MVELLEKPKMGGGIIPVSDLSPIKLDGLVEYNPDLRITPSSEVVDLMPRYEPYEPIHIGDDGRVYLQWGYVVSSKSFGQHCPTLEEAIRALGHSELNRNRIYRQDWDLTPCGLPIFFDPRVFPQE